MMSVEHGTNELKVCFHHNAVDGARVVRSKQWLLVFQGRSYDRIIHWLVDSMDNVSSIGGNMPDWVKITKEQADNLIELNERGDMNIIKTILEQIHAELEIEPTDKEYTTGGITYIGLRREVLIALTEALKYAIKAA